MAVGIRPANLSDLDALLEIEEYAFSPEKYPLTSRRQFRSILNGITNAELYVATEKGVVCGYVLLYYRANSRWGRMYSIAVHPDFQGGRVGKLLFETAEKRIRERHLTGLSLEIRADNHRHRERYTGLGYQLVEQLADYYPDGTAALKFRREL
ncbi:MAG: hypothetical protein CMJ46_02260 [Planctomyces sp.]|nr:hypothetical protein [Planctomyces sp.]